MYKYLSGIEKVGIKAIKTTDSGSQETDWKYAEFDYKGEHYYAATANNGGTLLKIVNVTQGKVVFTKEDTNNR